MFAIAYPNADGVLTFLSRSTPTTINWTQSERDALKFADKAQAEDSDHFRRAAAVAMNRKAVQVGGAA